jgi:hypothetical protein
VDAATYAKLVQLAAEYQLSLSALATMALHDLLDDDADAEPVPVEYAATR